MAGVRTGVTLAVVCLLLALGAGAAAAPADAGVQAWAISSASSPTNFSAGDETGDDTYVLTVVDNGVGSATSGSPVEVTDTLPSGLTASTISGEDLGNGRALTCRLTPTLGCSYEGFEIAPGDVLQIKLAVKVAPGVASSVVNSATVTGGGAAVAASAEDPTTISSTSAGFGVASFAVGWSGTQAGASVSLVAGFTINQLVSGGETIPAADPKEVALTLPPGFVVNTSIAPACSSVDAAKGACPAGTAVGVAFASTASGEGGAPAPYSSLVYNATPAPGELGALVLFLPSGPVRLALTLSASGGDQLRLAAANLPQVDQLISMALTLWGVPASDNGPAPGPDHVIAGGDPSFGSQGGAAERFLTSAGTCVGAEPASTLAVDSWAAPSVFDEASSTSAALTGCNRLAFEPSLWVTPDVAEAETPSGYEVDLNVPQPEAAEGLASAELKEAAVTLPEGAGLSLSAADGLGTCTEAQVALGSTTPATCPDAAKVGRVVIRAALVANQLEGAVYLAMPDENPFGASLALYIVAEDPISGVRVKLAAQLSPDPATGQLTIVLRELPQIPVSALDVHFFGGSRALLSTPPVCGPATSTSELTPWSQDTAVIASSAFEVEPGRNGAPCSGARAFSPVFQAGSVATGEADAYRSLTFLVSRAEGEQELGAIAIQAPAAVAQMFAGVPTCEEPQALSGTCPASEVGTVTARAGLGYTAAELSGGIYLTGPYGGGAQGLEIVIPVDPGPFELGTLVVRASAQIDPATRRLTIATDRLPSVVDGVPLHLGALLLQLNRGQFRISPDGCEPLTVTGTISSAQGGSITIATEPLGASSSSCPSLPAAVPAATKGTSPTATVSLVGAHIQTRRNGRAAIGLRCIGTAACHGTLILTVKSPTRKQGKKHSKTRTIGTATFSVAAGATAAIQFELNATGRALLSADHGRLSARLTIRKVSPAPSQTHTEAVQLVRQKAHGKTKR